MSEIRVETDEKLARIVLCRPDKANALTPAMLETVRDAVRSATAPVLLITGLGKVFSAGADLNSVREEGLATSPLWEEVSSAIASYAGFTIAALNGSCAGGAMGMMLACDCRITVPEARFFYPVMRMGVLPQPSDPKRLTALVGPARAKLLLLGGVKMEAPEAFAIGLVDQITEDLDEAVAVLTKDCLAATEGHVAAIKALIT